MNVIKTFSEFINESIWSDIQDRSAGDTVRQEDMITTKEELQDKIYELYEKQGKGDTLDVSSLTNAFKCDDFSSLFQGYKNVKYIIGLEDWDVSEVTNMKEMFRDCDNFNADLSKWNVSSVKDMRYMFSDCKKFNCDLSKWDVSNVEDMAYMFWNCQTFNSDLSNWNVSSVKCMFAMFAGCENFNSDLSNWNVSSVGDITNMFQNCKKFYSDLNNWDVSNVEDVRGTFSGCKSLGERPSWWYRLDNGY